MDGLRRVIAGVLETRGVGGLDSSRFRAIAESIMTASPDEIGCAECCEHMARLADMVRAGARAAEAMPLVQDHLARCRDCRQEYQALLVAVRATAAHILPSGDRRGGLL